MTKAEIWNIKADLGNLFNACKEAMEGERFTFFTRRDILAELENVKNGDIEDASELAECFSRDKRELLIIACDENIIRMDEDRLLVASVADELREISEWYSEQIPQRDEIPVQSPENNKWDIGELRKYPRFSPNVKLSTSIQPFLEKLEILPKDVDKDYFNLVIFTGQYKPLYEASYRKTLLGRAIKAIADKYFKGKINANGEDYVTVVCKSIDKEKARLTSGGNAKACQNFISEFKKII